MKVIGTTPGTDLSDLNGIESRRNGKFITRLYFGSKGFRRTRGTQRRQAWQSCRSSLPRVRSHPIARSSWRGSSGTPDVRQTAQGPNAMGIEREPVRQDDFSQRRTTFFFDPGGLPHELHEWRVSFLDCFRPFL